MTILRIVPLIGLAIGGIGSLGCCGLLPQAKQPPAAPAPAIALLQGEPPAKQSEAAKPSVPEPETKQKVERKSDAPKKIETPIPMRVGDLFIEYQANTLASDLKYKGKLLRVSGEVHELKQREDGEGYYLGLAAVVDQKESNVIFYIPRDREKSFAPLRGLQRVEVIGRLLGRRSRAAAFGGWRLEFDDARLASSVMAK